MGEPQQNIDALLAEVSALADEAVSDIVGDESSPTTAGPGPDPPTAPTASAVPPAKAPEAGQKQRPRGTEDPERILQLEVPVIVRLAERTMPLGDILGLSTGAIVEFDRPSDSALDLMINNKCIGQGQAVKLGENFGLRVTNIGTVHERIRAMGNQ